MMYVDLTKTMPPITEREYRIAKSAVSADDFIRYEEGDMTPEEIVAFFQRIIDNDTVWHLQGAYGRMAKHLIDTGHCHFPIAPW